jgi:dTMP kinase
MIASVISLATGGLKPDMTLVFDLPVADCLERTVRRTEGENKTDRLDAEDAVFHTRVRDAYLQLAADEPERVRVIESSGSISETHTKVLEVVIPFLESRSLKLKA